MPLQLPSRVIIFSGLPFASPALLLFRSGQINGYTCCGRNRSASPLTKFSPSIIVEVKTEMDPSQRRSDINIVSNPIRVFRLNALSRSRVSQLSSSHHIRIVETLLFGLFSRIVNDGVSVLVRLPRAVLIERTHEQRDSLLQTSGGE